MRDALNSNPLLQAAVVGVLLIGAGFFVLSTSGGSGQEESAGTTEATVSVAEAEAGAGAVESVPPPAVPPPAAVSRAYDANRTLVLLIVRNSGIDDRLVKSATATLAGLPGVSLFVVPAGEIARYAAITQGIGVERVPALVVVRPKRLSGSLPTGSVSYGYQSPESVTQAVIDAGYEGPTIDYHP